MNYTLHTVWAHAQDKHKHTHHRECTFNANKYEPKKARTYQALQLKHF